MEQFRLSGFVADDNLKFKELPPILILEGEIACLGRIVVGVSKVLEFIRPHENLVQTVGYSYNVSVRGIGNVFRHDNAHRYEGHVDAHHCHRYDFPRPEEIAGSPFWLGADGRLTLGEVIEEARTWHSEYYQMLVDPEGFVPLRQLQSVIR